MTDIHTRLTALCPGLHRWAGTRKVKPIWTLLKQQTVSDSGIRWAICKSEPRYRQITMPAPHHSVFYRPGALPAAQPTASKHWRHWMTEDRDKWRKYVHGMANLRADRTATEQNTEHWKLKMPEYSGQSVRPCVTVSGHVNSGPSSTVQQYNVLALKSVHIKFIHAALCTAKHRDHLFVKLPARE